VPKLCFSLPFATYFTLENRTGSGPTGAEIFQITPVLFETILLLTSSFTVGLGIHAMRIGKQKAMITFFSITLLLGLSFLGVEIFEFVTYVHEGAGIQTSAFTSALLTTLGTHGAHVTLGFFWGLFIILQVKKRGLTPQTTNKAFIFSLYWHFLDVVWIFIFSFIYLKGMM
jgi:cytochrome aa3-600 menaquinol oxidase subunit 3